LFDVESAEWTMQVWREVAAMTAFPVLGLPAMAVRLASSMASRSACKSWVLALANLTLTAARAIEVRMPWLAPIDPQR
jgi:hypothetical protein